METWKEAVRESGILLTLLWLALQDKKHLGISKTGLAIASGILLLTGAFSTIGWQERLGGVVLGALLLVFSFLSKGAIGAADGIVILVCGVAFGAYETIVMCFFAAVYAGCFSGVLLLMKRVGGKSRIPFLPFLLLGYITMRLLTGSV